MSMIIAKGVVSAIKGKNQPNGASHPHRNSLQKLSSGSHAIPVQDTGEDFAALQTVSTRLEQLTHNANTHFDAKNVLAIAEGALSELNSLLKWMQALALPPGNDGFPPFQIALEAEAEDFFLMNNAMASHEEKIVVNTRLEPQALSMHIA